MRTFAFILWWRQPRMCLTSIGRQFHLMRKPTIVSFPDGSFLFLLFRGVKRTRQGNSGFSCPDGGLPPSLSRFLSCS